MLVASLVSIAAAVALLPAASYAAGGLATVGRWDARGSGGAALAFTVVGKGKRRFAGDIVAFCGDLVVRPDGSQMYELDRGGGAKTRTRAGRFRLRKRSGRVSYDVDVKDARGVVACARSAFRDLQSSYSGATFVRDGEWSVTGTWGTGGGLVVQGGGATVHVGVSLLGPPSSPQTPIPCAVAQGGLVVNPIMGISPEGAFGRTIVAEDPVFGITDATVTGRFDSPVTASATYSGSRSLAPCMVFGTFSATWRKPLPPYVVDYQPGQPPIRLSRPQGTAPPSPKQTADAIQKRQPKVGRITCRQARSLVKRLPKGADERNYVVYWAPPPPPGEIVRYVGISRSLSTRCSAHPEARRRVLVTLDLPPLRLKEARQVEEALISHFGPRGESSNFGDRRGQLANARHELDPGDPDYCAHLLTGQTILVLNRYAPYSAAQYTRQRKCPVSR